MNSIKIKSVQSNHPCKSVIQTIYDIVKAHGGELKVETKPARAGSDGEDEGTQFMIILPS
jgi:hypothetical protein